MKMNLNSILNVELTEYGKEVAIAFYYLDMGYSVSEAQQLLNKKGIGNDMYSFTLLEFMKVFGNNITNVTGCMKDIDVLENKKIRKKK